MLVNDTGLHLSLSGCSEAALDCGRALGLGPHPMTIRRFRKKLSDNNKVIAADLIAKAESEKHMVLLMIDDYHTIHTVPRPTSGDTSTAIHMATCLADFHPSVPSIPLPLEPIHYRPNSSSARGSINIGRILDHFETNLESFFTQTWMECLPENFLRIDISDVASSLENLR